MSKRWNLARKRKKWYKSRVMNRRYIYLLWIGLAVALLGWFYQEGTAKTCPVPAKAKTAAKAVKAAPDLAITKIQNSVGTAETDGQVIVFYSIKNIGTVTSEASVTHVEISGPDSRVIEDPVPPLSPGTTYQGQATYTIAKKGKYAAKAKADYYNRVIEGNEANNQNQMEFAIGRSF